jgi:hypothetical protein
LVVSPFYLHKEADMVRNATKRLTLPANMHLSILTLRTAHRPITRYLSRSITVRACITAALLFTGPASFAAPPIRPCVFNVDVDLSVAKYAVYYDNAERVLKVEDLSAEHSRRICEIIPGDTDCRPPYCLRTIGNGQYCVPCN